MSFSDDLPNKIKSSISSQKICKAYQPLLSICPPDASMDNDIIYTDSGFCPSHLSLFLEQLPYIRENSYHKQLAEKNNIFLRDGQRNILQREKLILGILMFALIILSSFIYCLRLFPEENSV
uniref:Uncharacterized protein n=1 Tax=Dichotomosiphon tuberosus TaxID=118263 RepID=A0A386AWT2_9CHLO|nr:hypothetical protein [Dichotomosiphon tuberosus]